MVNSSFFDEEHDVVVIGSGMVGISCALQLQKRNHRVTLVDKLGMGRATSVKNACMIVPSEFIPITTPSLPRQVPKYMFKKNSPLQVRYRYLARSIPWFLSFLNNCREKTVRQTSRSLAVLSKDAIKYHKEQARGTTASKYIRDVDFLSVYDSRDSYQKDNFGWNLKKELGVKFSEVSEKQLRKLEPAISHEFKFAISIPGAASITDPDAYTGGLHKTFFARGGKFIQGDVQGVSSDDKVVKLIINGNTLFCKKLVIAAGAWSNTLTKQLGDKVPVESEGGYYIELADSNVKLNRPTAVAQYKFIATPLLKKIRLAGLVEFGGLDCPSNYDLCNILLTNARKLFPQVQAGQITRGHGQRPSTPDSMPVISRASKYRNIFYGFGHQHIGYTLGAITGDLVARMVHEEKIDLDIEPFRVSRF